MVNSNQDNHYPSGSGDGDEALNRIIGKSRTIRRLKRRIRRFSGVDFPLLITGESGSGKELVARAVHSLSHRNRGPFVAVNCAALPESLMEAEFFGHSRGAFTGAGKERRGLIESARGGTLFLDEIADLPTLLQAKLLRVLQEREVRRLGENTIRVVDVRLISATNRDIARMIQEERFREDLYFRLQDLHIHVPPLRERMEDIPLLARHVLRHIRFSLKDESDFKRMTRHLYRLDWPGNVRQLEARIKRMIAFYPHFEEGSSRRLGLTNGLREQRNEFERALVVRALLENEWNKARTAASLDISKSYLFSLIRKHGITPEK